MRRKYTVPYRDAQKIYAYGARLQTAEKDINGIVFTKGEKKYAERRKKYG